MNEERHVVFILSRLRRIRATSFLAYQEALTKLATELTGFGDQVVIEDLEDQSEVALIPVLNLLTLDQLTEYAAWIMGFGVAILYKDFAQRLEDDLK